LESNRKESLYGKTNVLQGNDSDTNINFTEGGNRMAMFEIIVNCPDCKVKLPTEHVYVSLDKKGKLVIDVTSKCLHPKEGCSVNQDEHWEWCPFTLRLTEKQLKEKLK